MPEHHSHVEHILIHSVAILFTFSALASAFLSYGVYQNNQQVSDEFIVAPPVQAALPSWKQTSWSGGTSGSVYTIQWNTTGGWSKYTSGSGLTIGGSGFTIANGGQLISSILDAGSKRVAFSIDSAYTLSVSARGANTSAEVSLASWTTTVCNSSKYRYMQYKMDNTSGSSVVVNFVETIQHIYLISGVVKDSSGNPISGATVTGGGKSSTTASIQKNNFIKTVYASGAKGAYKLPPVDFIPNKNIIVTATKTGYASQTKTITGAADTCGATSGSIQNKTIIFSLTKSSSSGSSGSGSSSTSSTSSGTGTATDTSSTVRLSEFQNINLPKIFLAKGSSTTNLSKVKDHKKIKNFTLDIPGKNKIVFAEELNLSTEKSVGFLKELDKYVKIDKVGKIDIDSKTFAALNKKAALTMGKIKHLFTPEILVNSKKDTGGIVSNIIYEKDKEILKFDVSHFTSFEAVPKLELISPLEVTGERDTAILGQVSDPNAQVTGRFNEVNLAPIEVDEDSGHFTITNLSFKEGDNFLTFEAKSDLGKVLPIVATIVYSPSGITTISTSISNLETAILVVVLMGALSFLILLGYLVYRRRKHHGHSQSKNTATSSSPA